MHDGEVTAAPGATALGARFIRFGGATHALLRIGAGLLYMEHGAQKLFGAFGGMGPHGGTVRLVSQMGLAGILECFGGAMIVAGLFTPVVAFLLMCEMLVAFFQVHLPQGGWPIQNHGELPLLYALIWAFLATHGAGPASADAALGRR